jgi:uncharacterized protein
MREYTYVIDEDGLIWQGGEQYDAPEIYQQFYDHMTRDEQGRLYTICLGEKCWVIPRDTPFVVQMVHDHHEAGPGTAASGVALELNGSIEVPLRPESLSVGKANVLYTTVREGAFPARFSRKAYYELARLVEKDPGGGFSLVLDGKRFPIAGSDV